MSQPQPTGLADLLDRAKQEMVRLSSHYAVASGEWDRAQSLLQWARELDVMIRGLRQNGATPTKNVPPGSPRTLPYHYIEADKLVKVGPSREGGSYEHRVTRKHFDLVVEALAEMARKSATFETPDLVNQCAIPKHEPLIVCAVLEERQLLSNVRRGRWAFVNPASFASDVQRVWSSLPRQ